MRWLKTLACSLGLHSWEWCGRFVFCRRCERVYYWNGKMYWSLDVADTRQFPELTRVQ